MRRRPSPENDRDLESYHVSERWVCRRDSSLLFSRLPLFRKEESQHHLSFSKRKKGEEDTDAQAGMPSQELRRNMRSKIR